MLEYFLSMVNTLPKATAQGLIWGVMAIGVYITYKVLDFADLTVDGSLVTGAFVGALLITSGVSPWLAIIVAFLAGAVCGLITGLLHTVLGIPAILSGILSQLALWSLNLVISSGRAILPVNTRTYPVIVTPINIWQSIGWIALILVVLIVALYWFFGTERGCSIRATGNNLNMSRAQGINTDLNKVLGLMISNALVALSGALLAQYQGGAEINMGKGAIVIGLAAVIIGEVLVSKISKNFAVQLVGVVLGSIVYFIIYQIISFIGIDTNLLKMLSALVVALFLAVPYLKKKYFSKRQTQRAIDALKAEMQAEENAIDGDFEQDENVCDGEGKENA